MIASDFLPYWATFVVASATLFVALLGIGVAYVQLRKTARASEAEALSMLSRSSGRLPAISALPHRRSVGLRH
jgi:hypothetical protein